MCNLKHSWQTREEVSPLGCAQTKLTLRFRDKNTNNPLVEIYPQKQGPYLDLRGLVFELFVCAR